MLLTPGAGHEVTWQEPGTVCAPVDEIGLAVTGEAGATGSVYLDYLTWDGVPDVTFTRPAWGGTLWWQAWANAVDQCEPHAPEPFRLVQNEGRGLLITGCREWADYRVSADVAPHMACAAGLAARVVKALDGETALAEADYPWQFGVTYDLALRVEGCRIEASVDGRTLFQVQDADRPLLGGGIALVCDEGRTATQAVRVRPL